jgi:hypothetical protein
MLQSSLEINQSGSNRSRVHIISHSNLFFNKLFYFPQKSEWRILAHFHSAYLAFVYLDPFRSVYFFKNLDPEPGPYGNAMCRLFNRVADP